MRRRRSGMPPPILRTNSRGPPISPEMPYPPTMDEDLVDRARNAVTERAELPGMSLIEHLEELRRRLIHSAVYLVIGFFVAYGFHNRFTALLERPLHTALTRPHLPTGLVYLNPIEPFNFSLKLSFIAGAIMASPFILSQVWLFISPRLYRN